MADYEEDVERIEREYVGSDSVDPDQILEDLEEAGFDFDEGDRGAFKDAIMDGIASTDDVGVEPNRAGRDGITTREDVEQAVRETASSGKIASGGRSDAITDAVASEVGAPSEGDLQRAQQDTLTGGETIDTTDTLSTSVVRDSRGNAVATIGGGKRGREVSEDIGAQRHYSSPQEAVDDMGAAPSPDGSSAALTLGDDVVGEVDL